MRRHYANDESRNGFNNFSNSRIAPRRANYWSMFRKKGNRMAMNDTPLLSFSLYKLLQKCLERRYAHIAHKKLLRTVFKQSSTANAY